MSDLNKEPSGRSLLRRALKFLVWAFLSGVSVVALLFVLIWSDHFRPTQLPAPTGQFAVGRAVYDWTDKNGIDTFAPAPNTERELLIWVWYPADRRASDKATEYLPRALREQVARQTGFVLSQLFSRDRGNVRANAIEDAAISAKQQTYPLVILRAGASLEVWNYSALAEDLASHGYVVAGIDAPYRAFTVVFPDGRVVTRPRQNNPELCLDKGGGERDSCIGRILNAWNGDIRFVIQRFGELQPSDQAGKFAGRVDTTRAGVFGHSFGGCQTAQFCSDDAICKAGVDIDGQLEGPVIQHGIHQPFMFLLSDHDRETGAEKVQVLANMRSVYDRLPTDKREFLWIRGGNHFLFGEDGALIRNHILIGALRMFGLIRIDPREQLGATSYCLRQFFDRFLKGDATAKIALPNADYPQLEWYGGSSH